MGRGHARRTPPVRAGGHQARRGAGWVANADASPYRGRDERRAARQ